MNGNMRLMTGIRAKKGKWAWIGAASLLALLLIVAAALYAPSVFGNSARLKQDRGLLVVRGSGYEAAFRADNGAIVYVRDKNEDGALTEGNRAEALWWAFAEDDTAYHGAKADSFAYEWKKRKGELVLRYGGPLEVEATVRFADDRRIVMQARVKNGTGKTIKSFRFPYELKLPAAQVEDALLPMLPGARLKGAFFRENNSYEAPYPGILFASYAAVRTSSGNLAVYDAHGETTATTNIGFKNQVDDAGKTAFVHDYSTALAPGAEWTTPEIVLELGGDYKDSIASYGERNGIFDYRSLEDKLGKELADYVRLPMYKMDISALKDASWNALTDRYASRLAYPGILHLVGFQTGGHDENYPDFMPPDAKWGGDDALRAFVDDAHAKGHRIVPYTNFSWWGVNSPTLAALPPGTTLKDIAVVQKNGEALKEDYGEHSGYVMNPHHPFVTKRIMDEHKKLLAAGFDGIFEDQWGIRSAPYMYNGNLPEGTDASTAYFRGVRDYFRSAGYRLFTEDGIDALADDAVGFMGTNLLWDLLGYRPKTAAYTEYYPMIGMLVRDKVLLYQHNLAAETMTDDQAMLRWNAAMGYNLSADLYNGADNPWVEVAGVFQSQVLSRYATAPVRNFEQLNETATRTDFGDYAVTANWDDANPYALDERTELAPGGFDIASEDGSVRAGNYVKYNGYALDPGEHDLVEVREKNEIRVYQPFGSDTTVRIVKGKGWPHAAAAAYTAQGEKIADLPVKEEGDGLLFDYIANILGRKVGYVALTRSEKPSEVTAAFEKAKLEENVALSGEAVSSTDTAQEFAAKLAIDGDPYTYWESMADKFPQTLTIDLGQERDIRRLVLRLPPQEAWEKREQTIEVQGSADGSSFAAIVSAKAYTFDPAAGNAAEIRLEPNAAKTRFVRLVVSGNTAWPAAQFSEVEVY